MGVAKYTKNSKDSIEKVELHSGINIKTSYSPADLKKINFNYDSDLGKPGHYPFTRAIHPEGYRSRAWTTRQYSGFGSAIDTNERFKLLIKHGQTGLNIAFDLPTQMGYDSDNPIAKGEVGRVGMPVDTLADFEIAFKDIDLTKIGVGLTINAIACIILAMYEALAVTRKIDTKLISATPQNDILKEIIGRGAWIFPVSPSVDLSCDVIEYATAQQKLPRCNPISICGYHIRESGATPAQEIAFAFCNAFVYIDNVLARGYEPDQIVKRFSFNFNTFGNIWEQIAKFRAARKLWAKLLLKKYDIKNHKALHLRGLFGGGGFGLTKAQPLNNIVRGAYYALSAALGGAQTTALCSYDEAYTIPSSKSALLSLNTLNILMDEVGLRDTVDPLAGSYFIETLTKKMENKILEEMDYVEKGGGMLSSIKNGRIQNLVSRQAYEWERDIEKGTRTKIGVNKYLIEEEVPEIKLHEHSEISTKLQIEKLTKIKRSRHQKEVNRNLKELEKTIKNKENVMPPLIKCCLSYSTIEEMSNIFRQELGEFKEPPIF